MEKTGRKGKILIDSIDLEILELLTGLDLGVLELAEEINLTHQNLKTHLEKLLRANLIHSLTTENKEGTPYSKKILLFTINNEWYNSLITDSESPSEIKKEREEYNIFIKILRKINSLDYESTTLSNIIRELKDHEKTK